MDADLDVTFFRRRPPSILPSNIVEMMERLGRHEIDITVSTDDPMAVWTHTQEPLVATASGQPANFVKALADACVPVGGFAVYGADKAVVTLIGNHLESEARRVLVLGGQPDSNVLFVTRRGDDYVGIIDAPWSSDDPTRVQNEWKHFSDQYDLYLEAGWNFQLWHWADPDIEPFMVTPKPLI